MNLYSLELQQLSKNNRYRLFNLGSYYYLLDCDSTSLFYCFPFLVYFAKHKCYEVSKMEFEQLIIPQQVQKNYLTNIKSSSYLAIIICMLLPICMNIINPYILISNIVFKFMIIISICMGLILFRVLYTKTHKLPLEFKDRHYIKIKLRPKGAKKILQKIYIYFFTLIFFILLFFALLTVSKTNYLVLFSLAVFMFIFLFLNSILLGIGKYSYKISE